MPITEQPKPCSARTRRRTELSTTLPSSSANSTASAPMDLDFSRSSKCRSVRNGDSQTQRFSPIFITTSFVPQPAWRFLHQHVAQHLDGQFKTLDGIDQWVFALHGENIVIADQPERAYKVPPECLGMSVARRAKD